MLMQTPPQQPYAPQKPRREVLRLVVLGLSHSGKTEFINAITPHTHWRNANGRDWYFGRVNVDEWLTLDFMEPPIEKRFDYHWMRDVVRRLRATGYIVLVDSTHPSSFAHFVSVLYTIRGYHPEAPIVVAANKQDHPAAWSAEDIQLGLGLYDTPVLPCSSRDRESVKEVILTLLERVL